MGEPRCGSCTASNTSSSTSSSATTVTFPRSKPWIFRPYTGCTCSQTGCTGMTRTYLAPEGSANSLPAMVKVKVKEKEMHLPPLPSSPVR